MKIKKYFLPAVLALALAAFLLVAPVAATDSISSSTDWQTYVLDKAANHEDIDVVLTNDITLNAVAGTESGFLKNVKINGDGHTITLNLTEGSIDNVALLGYVKEGTVEISNLTVSGKITMKDKAGKNRAAALIGYANRADCIFNNVKLENLNLSYGGTVGGFVGYAGNGTTIEAKDCSINKSTIATSAGYFAGGFIGWAPKTSTVTLTNCSITDSHVAASKVPSGGFAGCAAGYSFTISGCSISGSEIYGAFGQTGGLVGYLETDLTVQNTTIKDSTVISTGVPALKSGVATRAVVTDKDVGVGGFVGEMVPETSTLYISDSSISNCKILSNRGDMLGEVVGNGLDGETVSGVTLSGNTVMEINEVDNPDYYVGKATPTKVSTPLPLLGILAGLGLAGFIAVRKSRKH